MATFLSQGQQCSNPFPQLIPPRKEQVQLPEIEHRGEAIVRVVTRAQILARKVLSDPELIEAYDEQKDMGSVQVISVKCEEVAYTALTDGVPSHEFSLDRLHEGIVMTYDSIEGAIERFSQELQRDFIQGAAAVQYAVVTKTFLRETTSESNFDHHVFEESLSSLPIDDSMEEARKLGNKQAQDRLLSFM